MTAQKNSLKTSESYQESEEFLSLKVEDNIIQALL